MAFIRKQSARTFDGLVDIRDHAVAPPPDLVTEDSEPACPATPNRTFGNHSAFITVLVAGGRLLDYEPVPSDVNHEGRVVQVARRAPLKSRGNGLEDDSIQPN
jgi:hypothetical protein